MTPRYNEWREMTTRDGAVILGRNQFTLLMGLMDCPDYQAASTRELIRVAHPYTTSLRGRLGVGALEKSSRRLNSAWVTGKRVGRCIVWRLTPRGIGILERTVPAYIKGYGPYTGMAALRAERLDWDRWEALDHRWSGILRSRTPLGVEARITHEMVQEWQKLNPVKGMYAFYREYALMKKIHSYARQYVLEHECIPTGTHSLTLEEHGYRGRIDFDDLLRRTMKLV